MDEQTGWLFDVYEHPRQGVSVWLLSDQGTRIHLLMDFPITFYAAGDFKLLRQAWVFLRENAQLARTRRQDLFIGERDVLRITLSRPALLANIIADLQRNFPALDYYDADIPISLRFITRTGVHLLGRCHVTHNGNLIQAIEPLDSPWQIEHAPMPLRVMILTPSVDPAHCPPSSLKVKYERVEYSLSVNPLRPFLIGLQADLLRFDPDLILTDYGDTWLFPNLAMWCKESGQQVDVNRDREKDVLTRRANSYFAYGQVVYRGAQAHLFGRWHIDRKNAMMFNEYGLDGVLEQTRVTGLGVQEMARKSPGAGITAMQMLTALKTGVMVPMHKQQAEGRKTLTRLIQADRGGLIYQPIIGIHRDVAQIDFSSMYPSIMVNYNISPENESVGLDALSLDVTRPSGLIPQTLKPLLEKRLQMKQMLSELSTKDCEIKSLRARAAALKWLLVVCFGYLGYKNARFGRIESHEAVTAISRELMLQAKEVAEDLGFTVLHMYVDSLFVQKEGVKDQSQFLPLLDAIRAQTKIAIALDGVYRWIAFPPSRKDARIPVPNRYFGIFQNGEIKVRGIEARRRDTPRWVANGQLKVLSYLSKAASLDEIQSYLSQAREFVEQEKRKLKAGQVPVQELIVTQSLSRALDAYRSPSSAARAAGQLQSAGREVAAGQFMRFVFVRGAERVRVWDLGVDARMIDVKRYCEMLDRAVTGLVSGFETAEIRLGI